MALHLVSLTADIMLCDHQRKNPSKIYSSKKDIKSERSILNQGGTNLSSARVGLESEKAHQ
jgi:hypothetical protein